MCILPQILNISSENSLINSLIDKAICIEKFIFSNIKNIYVNLTVSFQELFNDLSSDLIKEFIEAIDLEFKNSEKRKERFYINKSNVTRTIVTVFGKITFHRTLYQDKYSEDDYVYNDKEKELDFSMFESSNSNVPILYTSNNLSSVLSGICHPSGLFR